MGSVVISPIIKLLVSDETSHTCVFGNFKSECTKWTAEAKIVEELLDIDVLQINGDIDNLIWTSFYLRLPNEKLSSSDIGCYARRKYRD